MSISHALGWGTWMGLAFGATSVPLLLAVVREMQLGDSELGKNNDRICRNGRVGHHLPLVRD